MPQIGVKYFIKDLKDIKLYLNGCFSYAILTASSKSDGVEDEDVKNTVDNVNIWGLELGVGSEYFFSKNFSLGGEFELRLFFAGSEYSEPTTVYTPNGRSQASTLNYKYNMNLGVTNSKITLNYYFND